jgi:hypothetical protein
MKPFVHGTLWFLNKSIDLKNLAQAGLKPPYPLPPN